MSIPYRSYGGGTPEDILRFVSDKNVHTHDYPLEIIEKEETVDVPQPARATKDSNNYEVFAFSLSTAQQTQNARGGSQLTAGATGTVRATFMPQRWRVYFVASAAAQILWGAPGGDAEMPAEFCMNTGANAKSDTLVLPGRSAELSVRADAANTVPLTVIIVAQNGAGDLS